MKTTFTLELNKTEVEAITNSFNNNIDTLDNVSMGLLAILDPKKLSTFERIKMLTGSKVEKIKVLDTKNVNMFVMLSLSKKGASFEFNLKTDPVVVVSVINYYADTFAIILNAITPLVSITKSTFDALENRDKRFNKELKDLLSE